MRFQLFFTRPSFILILIRRLFVLSLLAAVLPACSPPDKTDLLSISLSIPNVEFYPDEDESSVPLLKTATELAESFIDRGAKRGINGQMLITDATTTDEEILPAEWRENTDRIGRYWRPSISA